MVTSLLKTHRNLSLALCFLGLSLQSQSWQWAKRAGSTGDNIPFTSQEEQITDVKVDKVGNIYATGYFYANPSFSNGELFGPTTPNGFGLNDAYLIKYSACGKTLWTRRMGGTGYDEAMALVVEDNGRIMVLGTSSGATTPNNMFGDGVHDTVVAASTDQQFIARFDTAGNFKEVKIYPWAYTKMLKNSVGDYIITDGLSAVKINTLGITTFTYNFVTTTPYYPEIGGIILDKNDDIYISGAFDNTVNIGPGTILLPNASTISSGNNATNSLIMKFSSSGNMLWYQRGNTSTSDALGGCTLDTSNTRLATGGAVWNGGTLFSYYVDGGIGTYGNAIFILDPSSGNMLSAKTGSANYQGYITPSFTDRDNNFICTGHLNGFLAFNTTSYTAAGTAGNVQNCIGKFDAAGNFQYISLLPQVGSMGGDAINAVAMSEQGNIYIGGMFGGTLDSAGTAVNIIGGSEDGFVANYGFACNSNSSSLSPLAPTSLAASNQGGIVNYVNWVDNSHFETNYELWAQGGSMTSYSLIATLAANTTTYNHGSLQISTQYCYKARAINPTGPSIFTNIGCATTGTDTGVGLKSIAALADFNLYPNPTSGAVTLQFTGTGGKADLQVMNHQGQLLLEQQLQTNPGNNSYQLNLPQIKGLYIIRLSTGTATLVKKVVVE